MTDAQPQQPHVSVRKVETESGIDGLLITVQVQRFPFGIHPYGQHPPADDVPQDVRDALRRWLDSVESKA